MNGESLVHSKFLQVERMGNVILYFYSPTYQHVKIFVFRSHVNKVNVCSYVSCSSCWKTFKTKLFPIHGSCLASLDGYLNPDPSHCPTLELKLMGFVVVAVAFID